MTDKSIKTINPLTEKILKTYPYMTDAEALAVVQKSHDAFLQWRLKTLNDPCYFSCGLNGRTEITTLEQTQSIANIADAAPALLAS